MASPLTPIAATRRMEVLLVFAQPRQPLGAVVSWDLDEVPDAELNRALTAGQAPEAFITTRNVGARESSEPALSPRPGSAPGMSGRRTDRASRGTPGREAEADGGQDLGLFGPDRPELDDIRAGEDMSAEAWAEGSGEWPPSDRWVRRGLHNLVTRMTEELDAACSLSPDGMVTIRALDLDSVLMIAVSALYEADVRCGQIQGTRSKQMELEADC